MTSIIITYIDEHDFLAEAVHSAMEQQLDAMELIVVCNKTNLPDGYDPLHDLKSNLKFIHEPAPGSAQARNTGLRNASGEWIQYLDVDDLILPEKIKHQLISARNGAIVSQHIFKFLDGSTQVSKWLPDDLWIGLLNSGLGSTSSMLFHRETLIKLGGWSMTYQSHQEYELLFRLASSGYEISTVDHQETIVRERISGSITLDTQPVRAKEGIQLREKIWEYLVQNGLDTPARKNAFLQYIFRQLRGLYRLDRKEAMKIYRKYFSGHSFTPEKIGIPFYAFLYHGFGFNSTERVFSIYSKVRNKYLPFLPKNH
ncbi:MAG: glycosyltransferase family 2 protein [Saprospiraceae bacterium]|uniref:Glycosyltransferase family 2 protein n=1 Tax=Candidatus Opimibacter skivensis TaxID=2982028 RepID=A0A9D7SVY7_9BACT|nr:glycosyltransferase family 2 protein [Candidatus Opimibacter skivensis]